MMHKIKIATWNLERPTPNGKSTKLIVDYLKQLDADILILTESNECIELGHHYYLYHTSILEGGFYKPGDRQVSIFSKYPVLRILPTFREDTSICLELASPFGEFIIYGTIIGNFGNRGDQFKLDLEKQLFDFQHFGQARNFCIAGDFNISFSDNIYFTKEGRRKLQEAFANLEMKIITEQISQNIDHIVIKQNLISDKKIIDGWWNDPNNKATRLSDHKGVFVEISD